VTGKFLFLGRAIDGTLLIILSTIASQHVSPNEDTMDRTKHFIDYTATQEYAVLTCCASNMIPTVYSDTGYSNIPNTRRNTGGKFFASINEDIQLPSGSILNIPQIIKIIMSSAAEAEIGALFIYQGNSVHQKHIRSNGTLPTPYPIHTDNSTVPFKTSVNTDYLVIIMHTAKRYESVPNRRNMITDKMTHCLLRETRGLSLDHELRAMLDWMIVDSYTGF
jgi:hypothetical protein